MESIKQEIINNIYENGENLITGPILQEVLLDMVDDVNDKVASASVAQDIVEKTGSWDDAADWVEDNSGSLVHDVDLDDYATKQWVEDQGYLKEHQDISGLASTASVNELSESVANDFANLPEVDLSGYATTESVNEATESVKEWVEAKHYLTSASLSGSVTEETVGFMINDATASVKDWVESQSYATEQWVEEQGYLKEHQDISGLATTESVNQLSESVAQSIADIPQVDISGYLTTASYNVDSASFDERINAITGSDLSGYATTESLNQLSESFSESIPDVSGLATTASVNQLSESIAQELETKVDDEGVYNILAGTGLAEAEYGEWTVYEAAKADDLKEVSSSLSASIAAITGSGTPQDLSGYLTTASYQVDSASFDERIDAISPQDLSIYATTASIEALALNDDFDNPVFKALESSSIAFWDSGNGRWIINFQYDNPDDPVGNFLSSINAAQYDDENGTWKLTPSFNVYDEYDPVGDFLSNMGIASYEGGMWTLTISSLEALDTLIQNGFIYQDPNLGTWMLDAPTRQEFEDVSASAYTVDENLTLLSESVDLLSASFDDRINNIPTGSGSGDCLWRSSEGSGSLVPSASNCIARGEYATAIGYASIAYKNSSFAEGRGTKADGNYSHAEGYSTSASNDCEHAEGKYNATASSQIFSVGVGKGENSRVNAISIITGSSSQPSASIFIYGIGGYDGTNPTASVNDVATVINALSGSDLSGYATTASLNSVSESLSQSVAAIEVPDVSGLATTQSVNSLSSSVETISASFDSRINAITGSGEDNYLPLTGGTLQGDFEETNQTELSLFAPRGDAGVFLAAEDNESQDGHASIQVSDNNGDAVKIGSYGQIVRVVNDPEYLEAELTLPTESGVIARLEDIADVSESLSASIAAITSSGGGGSDTDLRNFLFGTDTQTITSITGSVTNIASTISANATLGFNAVPDDGRSLGITIHNTGASESVVTLPDAVSVGGTTYNLINNGVDNSGSMSIPAGEYGDIVVTRVGNDLFLRTSIDVSNIDVDLSEYATTASVNELSESLDYRLNTLILSSGSIWVRGEGTGSAILYNFNSTDLDPTYFHRNQTRATGSLVQGHRCVIESGAFFSHAEGNFNEVFGDSAHAEGYNNKAVGYAAHAEGQRTFASGNYSHTEGDLTQTLGLCSHAEGYNSTASGKYSHVEGDQNRAVGDWSHAEGSYTTAEGSSSHAEGNATLALGQHSHAEGLATKALGIYSHAEGHHTTASGEYEHAQGKWNYSSVGQIFSVGVGESENLRNALSIITGSNGSGSVYIQGVGSYNGTNPTPGTNDLASVISNLPISASVVTGSYTTETWTFVLEDSSSVSKKIMISLD